LLFTDCIASQELDAPAMILTCPACDTKYAVKDGAIPPGGRQVRCAACKHSWHQDPEGADAPEGEEQSIAEAAMIEPRTGPEAEERAYQEAMIEDAHGAVADDPAVDAVAPETVGESEPAHPPERDQWPESDPIADTEVPAAAGPAAASEWLSGPQRETQPAEAEEFEPFYESGPIETPRRRGPWLILILLLVAAAAAAAWYFAPESLRERLGLASVSGTPLEVMVTSSDRQRLASGNELFAVSGRVINPTDEAQPVPPLKAELLDASRQKVVYSWTIAPPATMLAPGASASFNSAEVDVPEGGSHLRVTLDNSAA
jgi:predicted Zn finger-like uncharacterized protein